MKRWKGTLADVADVFRLAEELSSRVTDGGGRLHRREITVQVPDGSDEFESADELEQNVIPTDLSKVEVASMTSGPMSPPRVSVSVRFSRHASDAVVAVVKGDDRTEVEGVRQQIGNRLEPGHRRGSRWLGPRTAGVLLATSLGFLVGAVIRLRSGEKGDVPLLAIIYLPLGGVLLVLSVGLALGGLLVPSIELLEPGGGTTRWMRARRRDRLPPHSHSERGSTAVDRATLKRPFGLAAMAPERRASCNERFLDEEPKRSHRPRRRSLPAEPVVSFRAASLPGSGANGVGAAAGGQAARVWSGHVPVRTRS